MPIIPTVLVNGSEGIGTGWSTFIPNYNPRDIIANIRRLLNDEPVVPMDPWYNRFKGTIEKTARKDTGVTYTVTGIIEVVGDEDGEDVTLRITELPIRKWTQDYKDFLTSLAKEVDKKEPFIKVMYFNYDAIVVPKEIFVYSCFILYCLQDLWDYSTNDTVHFEFILSRTNYNLAKQEGLLKRFKLTSTLSTSNMHLFDEDNKIVKYDCPEQSTYQYHS